MVFFTDFNISKDFKIGITNLLGNITTKDHSHKGGWAKLLRCQLVGEGYASVKILGKGDKLSDFDCIIFDLGAEFSGGLNLFGGLDKKVHDRLFDINHFLSHNKPAFSWKHELPDVTPLGKRRENKSTCEEFKNTDPNFILNLQSLLTDVIKFDHVVRKDKVLIGDSHTPSVWEPSYMIERRDGRTLAGMLRNHTIEKLTNEFNNAGVTINEVLVYAGNIDIRHHVLREENPWNAVQRLASDLLYMAREYVFTVGLVQLLPIEHESRKLPKTGYYKGTPYYGSWKERSAAVEIFNNILKANENGILVYNHPKDFYNESGELPFDVMERPQSVHLSPMFYRWDLDNNKMRY